MNVDIYSQKYMPRGEKNRGQLKHNLNHQVFGQLHVIGYAGRIKGCPHWRCICSCNRETVVRDWYLMLGRTRSCGCFRKELMRRRQKAALSLLRTIEGAGKAA